MKRTKIIATIGPATQDPTIIANLIRAGVNVFRQNFSHDIPEMHTKRIRNIKKQAKALNMPVAILADLQGPKIRVGDLSEQGMDLKRNQKVILTIKNPEKGEIPIQYKSLPRDVSFGDILLLDDGKIELKVFDKNDFSIKAKVIVGGILKSFKGINLPTASISAPALTAKDKKDLELILKEGVDFIALSFVRSADDIIQLRKIIEQNKGSKPSIVAKIERHEAVENLNEIIKASDAIMVARGDLGIELMLEKVPVIQ
ncbi:pyruvate kinase, partial [bacterium CG2_30_33_46]